MENRFQPPGLGIVPSGTAWPPPEPSGTLAAGQARAAATICPQAG
jgi:hypothetical protein